MFDWFPVLLSLQIAAAALLLDAVAGVAVARWMRERRFAGQDLLEAIFLLPLVLPPTVTGFALLWLLGKRGPLGAWLDGVFGAQLVFTPGAAVLASAVVAFPLMYQSAKAAFLSVDAQFEDAARVLGGAPPRVFWTITAPLAWPGLVAGAVLCFARALGEFGATVMVAGNIPGQTTTVPLAIYFASEAGDLRLAGWYALAAGVLNLGFLLALHLWLRCRRKL
jgi:molybdate transport system permease protein